MLKFCSIASGSSGNCYYVESEKTALLVDVGISGSRIMNGLAEIGADLSKIEQVFLTHEHIDHMKSVGVISKKLETAVFYASKGTFDNVEESKLSPLRRNILAAGDELEIADIKIETFGLSHDAKEPLGYFFQCGNASLAIVTDTGIITEDCFEKLLETKFLVLESNHDAEMLMAATRYPWETKLRIRGDFGHLSNDAAADCIAQIYNSAMQSDKQAKLRTVLLAHLSKETNFPELARQSMILRLQAMEIPEGSIQIGVARRDECSRIYVIK